MKVHWWRGNRFQRFMPASHAKTPTTPFFQSGEAILWRYQVVAAGFQNRGVVRSDLPGSRLNIPCRARAEHEDLTVINRKIEFSQQHHQSCFEPFPKATCCLKQIQTVQKPHADGCSAVAFDLEGSQTSPCRLKLQEARSGKPL
jgi:hypothetical protein